MGDRKPKKNSSGNADAHKAQVAKHDAARNAALPKGGEKKGNDKK